jgi:hypothetical protein
LSDVEFVLAIEAISNCLHSRKIMRFDPGKQPLPQWYASRQAAVVRSVCGGRMASIAQHFSFQLWKARPFSSQNLMAAFQDRLTKNIPHKPFR